MINQDISIDVFDRLKDDIITGVYPPGARLNIEKLKASYNIGACPLREALAQLTALGFVEAQHLKGFRVAALDKERIIDIMNFRKTVEIDALKKAMSQQSDEWEARLVSSYHYLSKLEKCPGFITNVDELEWLRRIRQFQIALLSGCHSPIQMETIKLLFDQSDPYCYLRLQKRRILKNDVEDKIALHKKIVDAALSGDQELACKIYAEALDQTLEILLKNW